MGKNIMKKVFPSIGTVIFLCFLISPGVLTASLTASSAQTIQGRGPQLLTVDGAIPADINDFLHFSVPDTSEPAGYKTYVGDTDISNIYFPRTLKLSDFNIDIWDNDYTDEDGDAPSSTSLVSYTSLVAQWKDKYGNVVSNTTGYLDSCVAPYTLTIEAQDFSVVSEYGDPISTLIGDLTKTFSINVEPEICFLKPTHMAWINWSATGGGPPTFVTGNGTYNPPSSNNFGAYYSEDFDPANGFKTKVSGDTFPTTGFENAKFTVATSSWPAGFSGFSSSNPAVASINSSTGLVTLTRPASLPTTVTISITPVGLPTLNYSFTIKKWAMPKTASDAGMGGTNYTTYDIATAVCGTQMATRQDLTSSPKNNVAGGSSLGSNNVYTRAIGTLGGEWGSLQNYSGSNWMHSYYWTSELYQTDSPFVVGVNYGSISHFKLVEPPVQPNNPAVVCIEQ
ncbi:hypothetical protein [Zophobihabitans entericus]|uniref:Uncharacterized protein n=1 Tax=Zophobihabitans entericus TaxID=1635327 RepID=A0A6G9IB86_9GAMM|nr:hypothetical protein [Zophobihabitans entericus]QIQ21498.1 hypothetical protein IPMB12_07270 [Zophobihabitans entericus]